MTEITRVDIEKGYMAVVSEILKERGRDYLTKENIAKEERDSMVKPPLWTRLTVRKSEYEYNVKMRQLNDYITDIGMYIAFIEKYFSHINESQNETPKKSLTIPIAVNFLPYTLDCLGYKYASFDKTIKDSELKIESEVDTAKKNSYKKSIREMKKELGLLKKIYDGITAKAVLHKDEVEGFLNIETQMVEK